MCLNRGLRSLLATSPPITERLCSAPERDGVCTPVTHPPGRRSVTRSGSPLPKPAPLQEQNLLWGPGHPPHLGSEPPVPPSPRAVPGASAHCVWEGWRVASKGLKRPESTGADAVVADLPRCRGLAGAGSKTPDSFPRGTAFQSRSGLPAGLQTFQALGAARCPTAGVSAGRAVRRWAVSCALPHAGKAHRRLLSRSRRCARLRLLRSACLGLCLLASLFPVDSQAFACWLLCFSSRRMPPGVMLTVRPLQFRDLQLLVR
ncbi:unnamed protein product [Rangifer tarandus platyrhynchus]|uniref:Uncharacterized protein n=1 Tax=Rangifer tarandus platyrhynchus TaxID=3082113 RepID=A0ABN8YH91_RANTA|nr:unnamed protein product [Rangifer tarandus platyrhynchus]